MGIVLAFLSAFVYGCSDFGGGRATRKSSATTVTISSQLAGFLALLVAAPLMSQGTPTSRMFIAGALGGVAGGVGIMLLYHALATGTMSIVSPVTAVCAAIVPLAGGLLMGERPGTKALLGLAFAIAAIVLVSLVKGNHDPHASATVLAAIGAGFCFGLFYLALDRSGEHAGLWPLVGARITSVGIAISVALIRRENLQVERSALPLVSLVGVMDMLANALFLYASRHGLLTITGVIASMYPGSTVILARWLDHERLRRIQWIGLAFAAAALVLISLDS